MTLTTRTGQRYEGVVGSTSGEGDTTGVTLKDVKDLTTAGAPLKDTFFIASTNIDSYLSGPADARPTTNSNGDSECISSSVCCIYLWIWIWIWIVRRRTDLMHLHVI